MYLSQNVNTKRRRRMKVIQEDMEIVRQVKKARNEANSKKVFNFGLVSSNYNDKGEWCGGKENEFRSTQKANNEVPQPPPEQHVDPKTPVLIGPGNNLRSGNSQRYGEINSKNSFISTSVNNNNRCNINKPTRGWQIRSSSQVFRTPTTSKSSLPPNSEQLSAQRNNVLNEVFHNKIPLRETRRNVDDEFIRTPFEINISNVRLKASTFMHGRVLQSPWMTKENKNSFETEKFSLTEIIGKICGEQPSQNVAVEANPKSSIKKSIGSRILSPSYEWSTPHEPMSPYFLSSKQHRTPEETADTEFRSNNLKRNPDGDCDFSILNSTPISIPVTDSEEGNSPYFNSSRRATQEPDIFSGGLSLIRQTYDEIDDPFSPVKSRWDKYEDDNIF